jgi:glucokinase
VALAIGIDVGGTKTAVGVVDRSSGSVVTRLDLATPPLAESGQAFLDLLDLQVAALRAVHGPLPVGIGLCELVLPDGAPSSASRVDWRGLEARAPGRIDADVRAAALAEARFGRGSGLVSFVYLNVGTGISHALVMDGRPMPGARGAALISASAPSPSVAGGAITGTHVVEDLAGGGAIAARFRVLGGGKATVPRIVALAEAGDPLARGVIDLAADLAGALVAQAVNWLDPEAVVLGGGIGTLGGRYGQRLRAAARAGIWSPLAKDIAIHASGLGRDAGLIGAALLAGEEGG